MSNGRTFGVSSANDGIAIVNPGISRGYKLDSFLNKVSNEKNGITYTRLEVAFTGPITVKDSIFIPTKKVDFTHSWETERFNKYNESQVSKGKPALTKVDYLQMDFENQVSDLISRVDMYVKSYIAKDEKFQLSWDTLNQQRTAYESAEAFLNNIDVWIEQTRTLLPQGWVNAEWDLILGKKKGSRYLEFPGYQRLTGRFAKLSKDTTRSLVLSSDFKVKFMGEIAAPTAAAAPIATGGIVW